jgi:hypothetical protein
MYLKKYDFELFPPKKEIKFLIDLPIEGKDERIIPLVILLLPLNLKENLFLTAQLPLHIICFFLN